MRQIITVKFIVPEGVVLLDEDENDVAAGDESPWSWVIENGTLYYWDDKGEEHEVEGHYVFGQQIQRNWVSGIVCRKCNTTLPRHTEEEHLDPTHSVHKCPHHNR